jgi:6-phosphofructokinase
MNKTSAVQTIGILTSGGDAPGMNAALSSSKNSMGKRY